MRRRHPRKGPSVTYRQQIAAVLEQEGPMTAYDISLATGIDKDTVSGTIGSMRSRGNRKFYIVGWVRVSKAGRINCDAVWANGDKKDAPRPKPEPNRSVSQRYRERLQVKVASVFEWGQRIGIRRPQTPSE